MSATPRFDAPRFAATEFLRGHELLSERLARLHDELRFSVPSICRISCALYDPSTDLIKTFIGTAGVGVDQVRHEWPLNQSPSLSALARTGAPRIIGDIPSTISPTTPHGKWLLEQGYMSSMTVPLYDAHGDFLGLAFFDSTERDAFDAFAGRQVMLFAALINLALIDRITLTTMVSQSVQITQHLMSLRDFETGAHLRRMALFSRLIARGLAVTHDLTDEYVEQVYLFAPLHDVGKLGVPDGILLKPGRLDPPERQAMQLHVANGLDLAQKILTALGQETSADYTTLVDIIACHHEFLDGSGYPNRLKGGQIPLAARIITVADVFDALSSRRPYKEAWAISDALDELDRLAAVGKLDGDAVAVMRAQEPELRRISAEHFDSHPLLTPRGPRPSRRARRVEAPPSPLGPGPASLSTQGC